ncbi:otefin [Eurosta solidaginis]|uniref:otefin n=1 Tax=Eurosta solidaginis TaxID=178769 RepID=UPI003530773F
MSEIDNLEALSNADLRKKCIEHGLPNVPITDSSRNLLIKKLRATLTGAPASSPKKTPRRETIHATKIKEVAESNEETKVEPERRTPSRGAGRRTIAGTPTVESQKAIEIKAIDSVAPAPIATRRRSSVHAGTPTVESQKAIEIKVTDSVAPAPIATRRRSSVQLEIPPSQKENKTIKNFKPVVILENDEDDDDLLIAAEQAEQKSKAPPPIVQNEVRSRSSRSVSLSKTGVVTTSYNQGSVKPLDEVPEVTPRNLMTENISRDIYKPSLATSSQRYSLHPSFGQTQTNIGSNRITTGLQSRYSTNTLTSGLYSSQVTPLYNEQSDEDREQKDYETPFLSSFARNLERIKTDGVPLGKSGIDMQSPHPIHRSKRYGITGRRPTNDSVTESFHQFLIALDRKYNLRLYLVLATVFFLLVFLYVVMYQ